jgi:hemoglobin
VISESEVYTRLREDGFERLVAAFYDGVRGDDLLQPMYPADDMEGAKVRLRDFLIQRFGGPTRYSDQRGHPRLRMRHAPFAIGLAERDRWLELMRRAMQQAAIDDDVAEVLWPYFVNTADHMINRPT